MHRLFVLPPVVLPPVVLPPVVLSLLAMVLSAGTMRQEPASSPQEPAAQSPPAGQKPQSPGFPAIDDMHHFMEYVCQPRYESLRNALAQPPAERRAWRAIRSDTLTLAETTAIVAARVPEGASPEQAGQWREISQGVFDAGKALYGAAGDYERARAAFELMVDNCNRCHQVFDNGRHQLKK